LQIYLILYTHTQIITQKQLLNCQNKQKIDAENLLLYFTYTLLILFVIQTRHFRLRNYGYNKYGYSKTDDSYVFI